MDRLLTLFPCPLLSLPLAETAQGIKDAIAEDLPLMIFANWRGFSGGQKDMFEEVLKFGAYIVDALRDYEQPVMVYLPPHATLRGGAWVVVDQTINEQYMEMYADETARGGVLETEGTLDVKYRKKDVLATAHRLDAKLIALDKELRALDSAEAGANAGARPRDVVTKEIRARENLIFPTYHQVATQFADLHDTPGRMKTKGCIQGAVPWSRAREFFYFRFQRKMAEAKLIKRIVRVLQEVTPKAAPTATLESGRESWRDAQTLLTAWIAKAAGATVPSTDVAVFQWLQSNSAALEASFKAWRSAQMVARMKQLVSAGDSASTAASASSSSDDATVGGLASIIEALNPEQKAALKKMFA